MITENMGLVYMVAKRFANRGTDLQDLTQIGVIGLIKAIDRFDTSLSYSFSTYAVPLIMGEIRRFLRDDGMIHTSRQMKEHARKIAIVREQMKKTQNKEPTLQELAEKTGIAIEDLVVAMEAGREVDSFSRPVTENDGKVLTLEEKLEDNHRFETPLLNHIACSFIETGDRPAAGGRSTADKISLYGQSFPGRNSKAHGEKSGIRIAQ